jgi:hypothetical protein
MGSCSPTAGTMSVSTDGGLPTKMPRGVTPTTESPGSRGLTGGGGEYSTFSMPLHPPPGDNQPHPVFHEKGETLTSALTSA